MEQTSNQNIKKDSYILWQIQIVSDGKTPHDKDNVTEQLKPLVFVWKWSAETAIHRTLQKHRKKLTQLLFLWCFGFLHDFGPAKLCWDWVLVEWLLSA